MASITWRTIEASAGSTDFFSSVSLRYIRNCSLSSPLALATTIRPICANSHLSISWARWLLQLAGLICLKKMVRSCNANVAIYNLEVYFTICLLTTLLSYFCRLKVRLHPRWESFWKRGAMGDAFVGWADTAVAFSLLFRSRCSISLLLCTQLALNLNCNMYVMSSQMGIVIYLTIEYRDMIGHWPRHWPSRDVITHWALRQCWMTSPILNPRRSLAAIHVPRRWVNCMILQMTSSRRWAMK